MRIKLQEIKGCKTCDEVLVFIQRKKDDDDFVQIIAWHNNGDTDIIQISEIRFHEFEDQSLAMEKFIIDFSESSANEFANSMLF